MINSLLDGNIEPHHWLEALISQFCNKSLSLIRLNLVKYKNLDSRWNKNLQLIIKLAIL